jgi:hypothetical protein
MWCDRVYGTPEAESRGVVAMLEEADREHYAKACRRGWGE